MTLSNHIAKVAKLLVAMVSSLSTEDEQVVAVNIFSVFMLEMHLGPYPQSCASISRAVAVCSEP